jgi:hypothetical protein
MFVDENVNDELMRFWEKFRLLVINKFSKERLN